MQSKQELHLIKIGELAVIIEEMRRDGFRLVQIGATGSPGGVELNYSFDKDLDFVNYRIVVQKGENVASASGIFRQAFLYENEIHDLFGVSFTGMAIDFRGTFYKLATRMPFQNKPEIDSGKAGQ